MTVSSILNGKGADIISAPATASLLEVAKILSRHRIGAVVVVDESDRLVGIASERDIVRRLAADGPEVLDKPISSAMTHKVITCTPESTTAEIMALMTENRIRHLPVMSGGHLAGFISIGDIVKERIAEAENEAEEMKRYIASGG